MKIPIRWFLYYAVATHTWWGVHILLFGETVTGITAISHTMSLGFSPYGLGVCYIIISVLAAIGIQRGLNDWRSVLFVLPQQTFLVYTALGGLIAVRAGQYADGTVRDSAFISADQVPVSVFVAVFHSCALLEPLVRRITDRRQENKTKGVV